VNKKNLSLILFLALVPFLLVVDMVSKVLTDGKSFNVIPNLLSFKSVYNHGVAFGWLSGGGAWLIIITSMLTTLSLVAWWFYGRKNIFASISFALFIAGAIGNLVDRIIYGHVRDFIVLDFWQSFAIFNFADICLTIGTAMLMGYYLVVSWKSE